MAQLYSKMVAEFKSKIQNDFSAYNEHCNAEWAEAESPNERQEGSASLLL